MNYHRWLSLDGTYITAIDVRAYKRRRFREALRRCFTNIYRRLTLVNSGTQILAATAPLSVVTAAAYV